MKLTSTNKPLWRRTALVGAFALLTGSFAMLTPWMLAKENAKAAPLHLQVNDSATLNNAKLFPSFAPVVKKVAPSVVKVSVTTRSKLASSPMQGMPDFRQFFGGDLNMPDMQREFKTPKQEGVGSGVIVSSDGYILTNNHVVDHADEIKVQLSDGRDFTGSVIGRDPKTDIAVIKIDANNLPMVTLADSDKIEVGDIVLAIGNPFGIGQTVTTGIISAKGRATLGLDYEDFIQTDAAINPGNSGGALVDIDGRLIGINTAILSHSGGNQGVGFSVPSNLARWVMESLVNNGHVDRGFLGVNIQDVTPQLAKEFKLDQQKGALISEVQSDSPAAKAGLKSGDVITDYDGKAVADSRHLKLRVGETLPGTTVPVKILRDGSNQTLLVTVKPLPGEKIVKASSSGDKVEDALHGVAVGDVDQNSRQQFQIPAGLKGALITQVDQDSPAFDAGLRQGDVITEINRKPVKDAEQAVAACEKPADKLTLVKVWSHGGSHYVVVDQARLG